MCGWDQATKASGQEVELRRVYHVVIDWKGACCINPWGPVASSQTFTSLKMGLLFTLGKAHIELNARYRYERPPYIPTSLQARINRTPYVNLSHGFVR